MKKVKICDREFDIDCNALTYIQYRKKFNRGIFEDFEIIQNFITMQTLMANQLKKENPKITEVEITTKLSRLMLKSIDNYIEAVTRIAYICCYTANPKIGEYEDWLKLIKRINTTDDWIVEVTEFAVDNFCG
ncbi:MAG: hypothetical protein ACLUG5_04660 [Clostridia bacterium]|jgi:hypothetical protein|uniref:Tail assembly chaperone protein n=1 Tax=Myoviridae sp. ct8mY9 TaxID=2827664 RepID=A0A8S5SEY1_9CAUD|nr:MAG TPA: tail assembly chaperone protein [Myoviridae sp. ct8mY9]DAP55095.1 MAG TPA: tail assembly chaperone protein [Caudoviricetes sp.]DAP86625.1 MAG TPA: tail assembly chaperone protein [Caudoviricetes sp.]DAS90364.1 MAG TPA: tail assembly chaperone protein [Caudoviricetes sp.]